MLFDPEAQKQVWDDYYAQKRKNQAVRSQVTEDHARQAAEIAGDYPHLSPGAVMALAMETVGGGLERTEEGNFVASQSTRQLRALNRSLIEQASKQAAQETWDEMSTWDRIYEGAKTVTRGTVSVVSAPIQEIIKLGNVGAATVRTDQSLHDAWEAQPGSSLTRLVEQNGFSALWETDPDKPGLFTQGDGAEGLGRGWVPGGDVEEERQEMFEEHRFPEIDQPVSIGAGIIYDGEFGPFNVVEPGTKPYEFTTALINTAVEFFGDPLLIGDKEIRTAAKGAKFFGGQLDEVTKLEKFGIIEAGSKRTVDPQHDINTFIDSKPGQRVVDWLTDETDFEKIRKAFGDAEVARVFSDLSDRDEVIEGINHFAGRQMSTKIDVPIGTRVRRALEGTSFWRAFENIDQHMPKAIRENFPGYKRTMRMGNWTPKESIPLTDANKGAEQFQRWMANMKMPKEMVSDLNKRFTARIMDGDTDGAVQVWEESVDWLKKDLLERGHDEDVVRELTRQMKDQAYPHRGYWREQVDEIPDRLPPGTRGRTITGQDGELRHYIEHVSPHSPAEMLEHA
ncbi:MAG: hypothetical protein R3185_08015, partial [Candidatus Thermoplasmatota archaeon]|nr:hypothetical protein [Candidatus Thermoplasmatota archaeon]